MVPVESTELPGTWHASTGARSFDNHIVLHDVSWQMLESVLEMRGQSAGVRVTYLHGELELMSPSIDHEAIKTTLGRLVEAAAEELGLDLNGVGSWTLKNRPAERAAEPDECYVVGPSKGRDKPDLAIEVIWTSGGIEKLEVYRGLGVREVWFWREGTLRVFLLVGERYETAEKSELLPRLDLELVGQLATGESQAAAVRELRRRMREGA